MRALVQRWGHTGFGLATATVWALPMAVWAGGADLSGTGAVPWVAFGVGLAALAAWLVLVVWAARIRIEPRSRRLDVAQMSGRERVAWLVFAAAFTIAIGWLNGAATVDWALLSPALRTGRPAAWALAGGLDLLLLVALAVAGLAWRAARAAWLARRLSNRPEPPARP